MSFKPLADQINDAREHLAMSNNGYVLFAGHNRDGFKELVKLGEAFAGRRSALSGETIWYNKRAYELARG